MSNLDWPAAFVAAVLIVSVVALIGYQSKLRAEVMKEAFRNGYDHVKVD